MTFSRPQYAFAYVRVTMRETQVRRLCADLPTFVMGRNKFQHGDRCKLLFSRICPRFRLKSIAGICYLVRIFSTDARCFLRSKQIESLCYVDRVYTGKPFLWDRSPIDKFDLVTDAAVILYSCRSNNITSCKYVKTL